MTPTSPDREGTRQLDGFAEFTEAFCRGFNAHKDGLSDADGEAFMAALMAEYEKWQGKRVDRQNELRLRVATLLNFPEARIVGRLTTHTFAREALNG